MNNWIFISLCKWSLAIVSGPLIKISEGSCLFGFAVHLKPEPILNTKWNTFSCECDCFRFRIEWQPNLEPYAYRQIIHFHIFIICHMFWFQWIITVRPVLLFTYFWDDAYKIRICANRQESIYQTIANGAQSHPHSVAMNQKNVLVFFQTIDAHDCDTNLWLRAYCVLKPFMSQGHRAMPEITFVFINQLSSG